MMRLFLVFCFIFYSLSNTASAEDLKAYINHIDQKKWEEASKEAEFLKSPALSYLVTWLKIATDDNVNFKETSNFIKQHPAWPKKLYFKNKIETSKDTDYSDTELLSWFKTNPPTTIEGKKKYITLLPLGKTRNKYIKQIWVEATFTKKELLSFIQKHRDLITLDDYLKRMNYLLFNNKVQQASNLLSQIPSKLRSKYKVAIHLQENITTSLTQYRRLPITDQNNIILLHSLAHFYNKKGDDNKLIETLTKSSKLEPNKQHYFWNLKVKLIRDLIKAKHYKTAYLFTKSHGNIVSHKASEAEWLSGWISLRFLNNPNLAITHFKNFHDKVKLPISISRGSYWLARSYEKLKDAENTDFWYKNASKYYLTFYGQIARCKINNCEVNIPNDPKPTNSDIKNIQNNILYKAALALQESKYHYFVQDFLLQAIDNRKNIGEIELLTKLGLRLNHYHLSVESAKRASYRDILIVHSNYPILKEVYKDHKVEPSLVMALIRQESVFNHKAISSAGAMGLMQLMPHVAKETAAAIKVNYSKNKLITDPHFNTILGINHLDKLLKQYNNSYILTIAAYNAGDKAVQQWINDNGDPRNFKDIYQVIDWMEKVSFYETRNYIQRVLEGKSTYYLLMNKKNKLPILEDLISSTSNKRK